jgi:hypothetical protein
MIAGLGNGTAPHRVPGRAFRRNDHEGERRRQPHRDPVGGDELAQWDAGVKPVGREVDQFLVCRDLELDLGIGLAEGCD